MGVQKISSIILVQTKTKNNVMGQPAKKKGEWGEWGIKSITDSVIWYNAARKVKIVHAWIEEEEGKKT